MGSTGTRDRHSAVVPATARDGGSSDLETRVMTSPSHLYFNIRSLVMVVNRGFPLRAWPMSNLSYAQDVSLTCLTITSSTASIVGSGLVLRFVRPRDGTYERLMFSMGVCDVLMSLGQVLQPFLTPKGAWAWSLGDRTTCNVAGMLQQLTLMNLFYYAFISYFFLLSIRYSVKKEP